MSCPALYRANAGRLWCTWNYLDEVLKIVKWLGRDPGQPDPMLGRDAHQAESEALYDRPVARARREGPSGDRKTFALGSPAAPGLVVIPCGEPEARTSALLRHGGR